MHHQKNLLLSIVSVTCCRWHGHNIHPLPKAPPLGVQPVQPGFGDLQQILLSQLVLDESGVEPHHLLQGVVRLDTHDQWLGGDEEADAFGAGRRGQGARVGEEGHGREGSHQRAETEVTRARQFGRSARLGDRGDGGEDIREDGRGAVGRVGGGGA